MTLLLDIGNSRVKWGTEFKGDIIQTGAAAHGQNPDKVSALIRAAAASAPAKVRVASVANPAINEAISRTVREQWGIDAEMATTQRSAGSVSNGYIDYRQLGVDRWLAIIAACRQCSGDVCIVDAGTAVTIDAVLAGGQHQGGLILPGLALMRQALAAGTGQLPGDDNRNAGPPDARPARDTDGALKAGALLAVAGAVDRCMASLAVAASHPQLIVTGGDASSLLPLLDARAWHRPLLVLEGLAVWSGEGAA